MPVLAWQSFRAADLDREYVVVLSKYAWPNLLAVPTALSLRARIQDHLRAAHGLLGYSIWTQLRRKRFYMLAVWENEQELANFADPIPPETVQQTRDSGVAPSWSVHWRITSDIYPPTWREAFAQAASERGGEKLP